nr:MAG TPA: hypothetical protein [Caudoviricetes sp.]
MNDTNYCNSDSYTQNAFKPVLNWFRKSIFMTYLFKKQKAIYISICYSIHYIDCLFDFFLTKRCVFTPKK